MDYSSKITGLENDLKTLITRWDRFFAGDLRVPPIREKEILQRRVRALTERPMGANSTDRFRLEQLQHRVMSYVMNWERMLREQEEGVNRWVPGRSAAHGAAPQKSPPLKANGETAAPVDSSGGESLFDRWRAAKADLGQKVTVDREVFEARIEAQRRDLEARMGANVVFEVKVADGQVKVTARRAENERGKG